MNWNPDDVVMTIWGYQRWANNGEDLAQVVADLAAELGREPRAVEAAIRAVGGEMGDARLLRALSPYLLNDERETQRLVDVIRTIRQGR